MFENYITPHRYVLNPSFRTEWGYLMEFSLFQATIHKTDIITTFGLLFSSLQFEALD